MYKVVNSAKNEAIHTTIKQKSFDNGPQFEFSQFALSYSFHHITSRPRCPQSNGLVERMVQTIKHLLRQGKES